MTVLGRLMNGALRRIQRHAAQVAVARPFRRGEGLSSGLGSSRELRGKFCSRPWDHFEIGAKGKTFVCCPKWLPTSIGNAGRDEMTTLWNSRTVRDIRASILDGSFRYCVQQECPLIQNDQLPDAAAITDPRLRRIIDQRLLVNDELPQYINLCYDESCNLSCPSCRRDLIMFSGGREHDKRRAIQERLVAALFSAPHTRSFRVNITGSGDPFASPLFRELLGSIDGEQFPNVVFDLQTNGLLFTPATWNRMARLHGNIGSVMVSFDAATAPTYAYTRRGGRFERLVENTHFIAGLRLRGSIRYLRLDFVVQARNYREMPAFVELAKSFGAVDLVSFNFITDWGTYGAEFDEHAIWKPQHPEFEEFLQTLRHPLLGDPKVYLGTVHEYRERALAGARDQAI